MMGHLNLLEFLEKHQDKSYFIGNPDLNWTLQQKKDAVTTCMMTVKDHPDLSMKALRILVRELSGCEELSSKNFFVHVLKSAGYLESDQRSTEGIMLLVNLLFQFDACRKWFNEMQGILTALEFVHRRENLMLNLKIIFICTSYSREFGDLIHNSGLCNDLITLLESDQSESIKKDIWKIFFNLATVCSPSEDLNSDLSNLSGILIKEILTERAHHEYCLQILVNLPPNSSWFLELEPIELCNQLTSRLNLVLNEIYGKHGSFPSTIQLYNQSFDQYISPYFWILNALANYSESTFDYIKGSLLPANLSTCRHKMPQYFGILIIHAGCEQIRSSIQELIFTLFNGNQNALVDYFGLGKVAGLLASKGLLNPTCFSGSLP